MKHIRRIFVFTYLVFFGIAAFASQAAHANSTKRPNIIVVLTDDQGYGDLGCTGNPILKTPNIDSFYKESVRFTDFHTSPTCAPTRAALMTGRHEFHSGVTHTHSERERLSLKSYTLAQLLKASGYATGIFGKWHLGDEPEYQPNRRGFDEVFIHGGGGIGQTFPGTCGDAPGNSYFNPAILHNGVFEKTKGYCTDVFFAQALKWIDQQRKGDEPFFAYITPNAPHAPLDCPPEYQKKYEGKVPEDAARFYGMIANIDDNFGKLVAKLKEWNIEENTLVIFMTDNGGTAGVKVFNAGMHGRKCTPYNGGTRVPSFWRWPNGFAGGQDVSALAAHIDIFPTFAELIGTQIPGNVKIDGRSLAPLLKDPKAPWADRVLFTHVGRWDRGMSAEAKYDMCSARDSRYLLVNARCGVQQWELFDLQKDPGETNNLASVLPEVTQRLKTALDQFWAEVQPGLVNENVTAPKVNPFKELYWKQFGGGPDEALLRQMDPSTPQKDRVRVYLLMGQSNMAGVAKPEAQDKTPHPRVFVFRNNKWEPAIEPLTPRRREGMGPGFAFGKAMVKANPDICVGLIPCAVGGTPLSRWQKGGDLYNAAVARAKAALASGTLAGILWHQGEADSKAADTAASYQKRLAQMIRDIREDLNAPKLPFVVGQIGQFTYEHRENRFPFARTVNKSLAAIPEEVPFTACVKSTGLVHLGDEVHFNTASQRELGERYAAEMTRLQRPLRSAK